MRRTSIRARLLTSFSISILIPSLTTAVVGVTMIRQQVFDQAQARVTSDLEAAKEILQSYTDRFENAVRIHATRRVIYDALEGRSTDALAAEMHRVRQQEGLDILTALDVRGRVVFRSSNPSVLGDDLTWNDLVAKALHERKPVAALTVVPADKLELESPALKDQAFMQITPTPKAEPTAQTVETRGLMLETVAPIVAADSRLVGFLVGGVLLNRNFELVDKVRKTVFKEEIYLGQEVGTGTIFLYDVRVSTNVKNADGSRAITTRASAEVAQAVLGRGETWRGRAFVVNDWYIAAYSPIHDIHGATIGMLYVGTLERPYVDSMWQHLSILLGITLLGVLLVSAVAIFVAQRIARPVRDIADAAMHVAQGDYSRKVRKESTDEIGDLAEAFNQMTFELERAHRELREWGENLERKVTERTAELKAMQAQMVQADKLASLGSLVAGIAHEINNPNTFIRGNVTIVAEAFETILPLMDELAASRPDLKVARLPYQQFREQISILVADIRQGADKIMNIVADMRTFARRDEGLLTEDVDVNVAVESCLRLVQNQVKRVANVRLDLTPALPTFKGNVQKIEQVLVNIIMNAAQAIEETKKRGGITIRTLLFAQARQIQIRVADDGIGMTEEVKKQIFDPFFTTKRHKHGTGLGLSITYGIIAEHGGRIDVRSKPGEGSEFCITLPLEPYREHDAPSGGRQTNEAPA